MNINDNLLLETVSALKIWLENRITQDTELQKTLTSIEASIKQVLNEQKNNIITLPTVADTEEIQPSIKVSAEKIAELQSKWTSPITAALAVPKEPVPNYQANFQATPLWDPKRVDNIRRCLILKADAFCLQIDKLADPTAPTELAQAQLIARANNVGTRLWIFDVSPSLCPYIEQLEDVSTLFLLCADSCVLLIDLLNDLEGEYENTVKDPLLVCLKLVAEAQSMLKTALERVTFTYEDPDQKRLFSVVRDLTKQKSIYIDRYMQTRDQADPSQWRDLQVRLQNFARHMRARRNQRQIAVAQQRVIKHSQGQISYHLGRIKDGGLGVEHDWRRIADALIQWSESGLRTDDQRLRTILSPVAGLLPEPPQNESQSFIKAYLQTWDDEEDDENAEENEEEQFFDDPVINRVAEWLCGQTIVLIGGSERQFAKTALIRAFSLADVIWITTRPHESLEILKTPIRRSEVKMVVLAIRWASHAYGNISAFCSQLDKPFIRLPTGYNPRRVAHEVVSQASKYFDVSPS